MYKLSTSAKDTDELSTGFDRGHVNRQRKLAEKKKNWREKTMLDLCSVMFMVLRNIQRKPSIFSIKEKH